MIATPAPPAFRPARWTRQAGPHTWPAPGWPGPLLRATRVPPERMSASALAAAPASSSAAPTSSLSPRTLNDAEAAALEALQHSCPPPDASARAAALLRQAGASRDVDGDAVLGALAHALTAPTPLPGSAPATPAALAGAPWRLVFSHPAPLPAWRYIPVPEFFAVPPSPVSLSSDVGPLHFMFSGAGEWKAAAGGEAAGDAALAFAFSRMDVQWGRDAAGPFFTRALGGGGGARPPKTYTFFAHLPAPTDGGRAGGIDIVCARSSGGALSLLARPGGGRGGVQTG